MDFECHIDGDTCILTFSEQQEMYSVAKEIINLECGGRIMSMASVSGARGGSRRLLDWAYDLTKGVDDQDELILDYIYLTPSGGNITRHSANVMRKFWAKVSDKGGVIKDGQSICRIFM
jgi:hypothetical protein